MTISVAIPRDLTVVMKLFPSVLPSQPSAHVAGPPTWMSGSTRLMAAEAAAYCSYHCSVVPWKKPQFGSL